MEIFDEFFKLGFPFLPLLFMILALGAIIWFAHWFLLARHAELGSDRKFPRQIVMLLLTLFGLIAIILVLPVSDATRNKLIGLIGILISGIIAFSSTTIVANFMAGILLRITKPFRTGDFIRVGDHFGRVSERGMFDTEIQSESRELIALPNTYLISNPVTTTRSSGTIISTALSLGYDQHHSQIEPLLIKAAEDSGLEEPFVHILDLGNYSVTYRISGLLSEVKWLITARSNLSRCVLDTLHAQGIQIMSPTYMNQRRLDDGKKIIPSLIEEKLSDEARVGEDIAFDKAEQAEQIEQEKKQLINSIKELETALKEASEDDKKRIKGTLEEKRERLKALEQKTPAEDSENHTAEQFNPPDRKELA